MGFVLSGKVITTAFVCYDLPMHSFFLAYQTVVTTTLLALAGIAVYNVRRFMTLASVGSAPRVRVSVLVPARNEERCIEACITSLCEQSYDDLEVIVLDDQSTDATPQILQQLQHRYHGRLTVITGSDVPEGWVGKSWACATLATHATGRILLFTDADTAHAPDCIARAVQTMHEQNLDFFSLIPFEEMGTPVEHLVIPMVHVLYFAYVPNDRIMKDKRVSLSAANGQFMCFRREAYDRAGGHASVRDALVEDVFLARHCKRLGMRIALVDGSSAVVCRMYTSAREVFHGFSKNFFPATSYNLPLTTLFLIHLATAFVFPLLLLPFDPLVCSIQLLLAGLIRILIAQRFRMPLWHGVLQPISAAWTIAIGINSIRWAYSRRGSQWKGRSYPRQGRTT